MLDAVQALPELPYSKWTQTSTHPVGEKKYQIVIKRVGILTQSCTEIKTRILKGT